MAASKPAKTALPRITLDQARKRWHQRQGLAAAMHGTPGEIVAATSWPRTLGGVDAYLTLRARAQGLSRAAMDAAIVSRELQVVPAARGCIYIVPRREVGLVLRIAEEQWRPRTGRELEKAGSSWKEVESVAAAAEAALKEGALSTDALRRSMPKDAVRSLGEAGKKIGMSSPLPVALRLLEFRGAIERTLPGGRVDSERYEWRLAARSPFLGADIPADAAGRLTELARIFFRGAAPATVKEFAEWAALSQRDARAAIESAGLEPLAIEGHAEEAFGFAEDRAELPPAKTIRLLSFQDSYLTDHGGPAPLCDPLQHGRVIPLWGSSKPSTLGAAKHMSLRPIVVGDRLAGFWEYDPDRQQVAVGLFDGKKVPSPSPIWAEAEALGTFIRDELAHGRSFSLDTDDALRERAAFVSAL